jgi:hypothetical protein
VRGLEGKLIGSHFCVDLTLFQFVCIIHWVRLAIGYMRSCRGWLTGMFQSGVISFDKE